MNATPVRTHHGRLRRTLRFIDENLDEPLSLERLAEVAAMSKFHFHRRFTATLGLGVHRYVRLLRLKRATFRLAFRDGIPITEIALDGAYEGPEAFSRAFKRHLGQTPSGFRKRPAWRRWAGTFAAVDAARSMMVADDGERAVTILDFKEIRVAALAHHGDPALLGDTLRRFIAWRRQALLPPAASATFNLVYCDPATTPAAAFRLDICAATDRAVAPNAVGVVGRTIPGGRCAKLRHVGSDATLGEAIAYLPARWLPRSGETRRDFPVILQRVTLFPDVPEHEAVTDIFLPLA